MEVGTCRFGNECKHTDCVGCPLCPHPCVDEGDGICPICEQDINQINIQSGDATGCLGESHV